LRLRSGTSIKANRGDQREAEQAALKNREARPNILLPLAGVLRASQH